MPFAQKIDFNRELVTVAVSNMATGAAGCGYTGSYIFRRAPAAARLPGCGIAQPTCRAAGMLGAPRAPAVSDEQQLFQTQSPPPVWPHPRHHPNLPHTTHPHPCSQTIFTMRAGVYSRWNGVVVAASEFAMFALPFPGEAPPRVQTGGGPRAQQDSEGVGGSCDTERRLPCILPS